MMKATRVTGILLFAMVLGLLGSALADTSADKPAAKSTGLVNLVLKDVTVKQAIDKLFDGRGLSYSLQLGTTGKIVELTLKGISFDQALKSLTDAAGLTYRLEDGTYVITPAKTAATGPSTQAAPPVQEQQPPEQPQQAYQEPVPGPPVNTGNTVVVGGTGPVFYGHPGPGVDLYGGYGPPLYQFGNVGVLPGRFGNVVVVDGGHLNGAYSRDDLFFPPPPGWVSPDMLRFLQNQWALAPTRHYPPPYGY